MVDELGVTLGVEEGVGVLVGVGCAAFLLVSQEIVEFDSPPSSSWNFSIGKLSVPLMTHI